MVSSGSVPWYNRPARPFPAKEWLMRRYGFTLPPLRAGASQPEGRREFPAKRWLREHRR
jgi:hypothetical protein